MVSPDQIERQILLEREQIRLGIEKLRDNTKRLEDKEYSSASVYGIASIESLLPLVTEEIERTNSRIHQRQNGVLFKEIAQYLHEIEPMAAASITCKIVFDKVFSTRAGSNQLVNICDAVGNAVENEAQLLHYQKHAPGLLEVLKKNYWHKSTGTQQKVVVIQTLMNRCDVKQWKAWGRSIRVKLGGWLLECVLKTSGWFQKDIKQFGNKSVQYLIPTDAFMKIKDEVMANAELFAPLTFPMLIPPNDWENGKAGGYLLNEVMLGHDMVRRSNSPRIQGEKPIAFLNKVQKVAYTLNPFTVSVAEQLEEKQISVGKFLPVHNHELPPKPSDIAENAESRKAYRRAATKIRDLNAQEFKKSCRTRLQMEAVKRFKDVDKFWIPWSFDYRSRIYPIPALLTPQCTDFGKSLLKFADESFMDDEAERWIRFSAATTYGLDKETIQDRLHWTYENEDLISRIALDPIGTISEWEVADEPWQFLSSCDEMYHCVIKKDRCSTGLMVAIDATCSGLQLLASLAADRQTASLVNVLPTDKPQDAYKVVAETAKPNCPDSVKEYMDRKTVKRVVMTLPYNSKFYSNKAYIKEALLEKGVEVSKEDLIATVHAVRDAMNVIVPGPMRVMKWIEEEVSKALKRGVTELSWVTPTGFVVTQRLMKKQIKTMQLQLLGLCKMSVATDETKVVDKARHKAATAPNLIHSMDASLLCLSTLAFNNKPIALIHDSVLCRATDMTELSKVVRETYKNMFANHDYLTDFARQIGAETNPPIIGDLKPESVIESTYFFC
ncbi:MAG: T7 RNA polymerase [Flavobacteriales bacterium]|mgnify:FL=1|nr:T7 RNA polymerase [Flavobacteriales bacterium]|tara:strand:- start:5102 stop:7444 length:2343 start_codon:yes stop_codon:yes gene_type:complete